MTVVTRHRAATTHVTPAAASVSAPKRKKQTPAVPAPSSPARRSNRLNPTTPTTQERGEPVRKRRKSSHDTADNAKPQVVVPERKSPRNRSAAVKSNHTPPPPPSNNNAASASAKGNNTEQPSGIMPLSVVDVGVVKGLAEVPDASPVTTALKVSTPGASSPPLEPTTSNLSPPSPPLSPKSSPKSPPPSPGSSGGIPSPSSPVAPVSPISLPISGLPIPPIPPLTSPSAEAIPIDPSLLDNVQYGEEDADGEPDDSFLSQPFDSSLFTDLPADQQEQGTSQSNGSGSAPENQVLRKSTAPRIPSPLKAAHFFDSSEDEEDDMEEVISIHAGQSDINSVSYRASSNNTIWETACKFRIWEVQKRYSLNPHFIRSFEEEMADGHWRRHGWPSDLPQGQGRGLLTRSPTPSPPKRLRSPTPSPSPTKVDLTATNFSTPSTSPTKTWDFSNSVETPSPSKKRKRVDPDQAEVPEDQIQNAETSRAKEEKPVEKRITRSQKRVIEITIQEDTKMKATAPRGRNATKKVEPRTPSPSPTKRITRSSASALAAATPPTPASPSRKRKAPPSTPASPVTPRRKSARLNHSTDASASEEGKAGEPDEERGEEDEVEQGLLLSASAASASRQLPRAWWDDDDSLSDLTDSDGEGRTESSAAPLAGLQGKAKEDGMPAPASKESPLESASETQPGADEVDDDEDDEDEDEDSELTEEQLAEFKGMSGADNGEDAFLNRDLSGSLSASPSTPSNAEDSSQNVAEPGPSSVASPEGPIQSTFYIPMLNSPPASPISTTFLTPSDSLSPSSPIVSPDTQLQIHQFQQQLQQFPTALPHLSSIPVPGLRQLDLSVPSSNRPAGASADMGGRRKGERELGFVGGWGTPIDRRRRRLWSALALEGKGKGKATTSAGAGEDDEHDEFGRTGTLRRAVRPPPVFGSGAQSQMMLQQFNATGATTGYDMSQQGQGQSQTPVDWFATATNAAGTSTAGSNASRTRVNGVELDTPEWENEAFMNGRLPGQYIDWFLGGEGSPSGSADGSGGTENGQGLDQAYANTTDAGDWNNWSSPPQQQSQFLTSPSPADTLVRGMGGWDFSGPATHSGQNPVTGGPSAARNAADWASQASFMGRSTTPDPFMGTTGASAPGGSAADGGNDQAQWFTQPVSTTATSQWNAGSGSADGGELRFALGNMS